MNNVIDQFRAAMAQRGIAPPVEILADGRLHRCCVAGKNGKRDAAYMLCLDQAVPWGGFQNWTDGLGWTYWRMEPEKPLNPTEEAAYQSRVEVMRQAHQERVARKHEKARQEAQRIYGASIPCEVHPYLKEKSITANGARLYQGTLILPLMDENNVLHSLQFISDDGAKKFLRGGRVQGCFYLIGVCREVLYIAEGFATAASIHTATGHAVVVAFNANNLKLVAEKMRKTYPEAQIVVCADDDHLTPGNPGLHHARLAAEAIDGVVAVPDFGADRVEKATDFNDLFRLKGTEAVKKSVAIALDGLTSAAANFSAAKEVNQSATEEQQGKKSQTTLLLEMCETLELFHDECQSGYAILGVEGVREVWAIQSSPFQRWLEYQYYLKTGNGIRGQAMTDALNSLEAKARYLAPERQIFLRVARQEDKIYIDLADAKWRVIEIDKDGWRVLNQSPVMFTRSSGMLPLPEPVNGGSLAALRGLLNVRDEDFPLVAGWLLMGASGCGPYPILGLEGEHGSGKSTFSWTLRCLLDPSAAPLRGVTRDVRDLRVSATNNHIVVLDNLSGLNDEMSDVLCRIATGGGFSERKLYTNSEEVITNIQRPIILNGIDQIATRGDLLSRSIIIQLPIIPDTARAEESVTKRRFQESHPALLGGLCDALSHALREYPHIKLKKKPRMADFAVWVTAAEGALGWPRGTIIAAYERCQSAGIEAALDASLFVEQVIRFMDQRVYWHGTASDLLQELERKNWDKPGRTYAWPTTGKAVANSLQRNGSLLRHYGLSVERKGRSGHGGRRIFEIKKCQSSSASSPSSYSSNLNAYDADETVPEQVGNAFANVSTPSAQEGYNHAVPDDGDGADDASPNNLADGETEIEL